jgi:hypothetical protein
MAQPIGIDQQKSFPSNDATPARKGHQLARKPGLARMPANVTPRQLLGVEHRASCAMAMTTNTESIPSAASPWWQEAASLVGQNGQC